MLVRVLEEEPDDAPAAPREQPPPGRRPTAVVAIVAVLALGALVMAQPSGGSILSEDVPSRWEDVPMTCDTLRIEQGDRAIERFRCRALGGAALPAGVFRPPGAHWTSDITRRPARDSRIEISPDGEVVGWAVY